MTEKSAFMKKLYSFQFPLFLLFTLFSTALFSQTYVKHDAAGSNDGSSWANAYTDLTMALADDSSNEYWIAAGTYHPGSGSPSASSSFIIDRDLTLYGGFAGTETMADQRNPAANETILSGDIAGDDILNDFSGFKSDNVRHVIAVDPGQTGVVIDGFSIIGGHTLIAGGPSTSGGGGIYARSSITVSNCKFLGNFAGSGGGIYLAQTASGSTIEDCTFTNNSGSREGAGIFALVNTPLTVKGCTFADNRTEDGVLKTTSCGDVLIDDCAFNNNVNTGSSSRGGAMYIENNTNFVLSNSEFNNNRASQAGAINIDGTSVNGDTSNLKILSCQFNFNEGIAASGFGGGGAIRVEQSSFTVDGCSFDGNETALGAGDIFQFSDGKIVAIRNSSFKNATCGGWGGSVTCYGASDFFIEGCEFSQNTAANFGGGINNGFGAVSTYTNCNFEENSATVGGALALQNEFTTIIAIDSDFTNNSSSSNGGAIFSGGSNPNSPGTSGILVVDGCDFLLNTAAGTGGAIYIVERGSDISDLTLSNSTFYANASNPQAGALNLGNTNAVITSCAFGANQANDIGTGGAISINAFDGDNTEVMLMNSVFADNIGSLAAGVAAWTDSISTANTIMQNCIFRHEGAINYAIEDGTPTVVSNGGNMSDDGTLVDDLDHATDIHGEDPDFVAPSNFEYALNDGSPAIDAGVDAGAPEFDLLGNPRINRIDIGAYENQNVTDVKETLLENNGMLKVAPNPVRAAHVTATLDNQWNGEVLVQLFNVLGQAVKSMEISKNSEAIDFQVDLEGVKVGVYELIVSNGQEAVVARLLRI